MLKCSGFQPDVQDNLLGVLKFGFGNLAKIINETHLLLK